MHGHGCGDVVAPTFVNGPLVPARTGVAVAHSSPGTAHARFSRNVPVAPRNPPTRISSACPVVAVTLTDDCLPQVSSLHASSCRLPQVAVVPAKTSSVVSSGCGGAASVLTVTTPVHGAVKRYHRSLPPCAHVHAGSDVVAPALVNGRLAAGGLTPTLTCRAPAHSSLPCARTAVGNASAAQAAMRRPE